MWESLGSMASPRLVGNGLSRQWAQHHLLFSLGISGRPGQRLGLPDWGLRICTHTPSSCLRMLSAPPGARLMKSDRIAEDAGGPFKAEPASREGFLRFLSTALPLLKLYSWGP